MVTWQPHWCQNIMACVTTWVLEVTGSRFSSSSGSTACAMPVAISYPLIPEFPFKCNNGIFLFLLKADAKLSENGKIDSIMWCLMVTCKLATTGIKPVIKQTRSRMHSEWKQFERKKGFKGLKLMKAKFWCRLKSVSSKVSRCYSSNWIVI